MAIQCPKCGSKRVACTNRMERAWAWTAGFLAGGVASIVSPSIGGKVAADTKRDICPKSEWICLDCKHTFSVQTW